VAERWQPGSKPVTAADLPTVLAGHPYLVVHFWAIWNGYDRRFEPTLAAIRREYEGRVVFRSIDVDEPELVPFCRASTVIGNVPALGFFVRGERVETVIGMRSGDELRAKLDGLLAGNG